MKYDIDHFIDNIRTRKYWDDIDHVRRQIVCYITDHRQRVPELVLQAYERGHFDTESDFMDFVLIILDNITTTEFSKIARRTALEYHPAEKDMDVGLNVAEYYDNIIPCLFEILISQNIYSKIKYESIWG